MYEDNSYNLAYLRKELDKKSPRFCNKCKSSVCACQEKLKTFF